MPLRTLLAVCACALLAACGGSSSAPGPVVTPDGDDASATARALAVGGTLHGAISAPTDRDYLTFTTTTVGTIEVALTGLSADLDLVLYDASMSPVAVGSTASTTAETVTYRAAPPGTYYALVTPRAGGTSAYDAAVALAPSGPGETFDTATTLWRSDRYYEFFTVDGYGSGPTGETVLGSLDARYYVFDPVAAGTIVVLARNAYGDQDVTLYDADRNPVAASANVGRGDDRIDHPIAAGGRYYLKVQPAESMTMLEFDVWLETTRTGEPNEEYLQGTFVGVPSVTSAAIGANYVVASETRADLDWYELGAPGPGTLTVRVSAATADLSLAVYGAGAPVVPLATSETAGVADETVTLEVAAAGVYRACVGAATWGDTSTYTLTVEFAATAGDGDDTSAAAKEVAVPSTSTGEISIPADVDFLTFTTTTAGRIDVALTGLSGDLDLVLYDAWATALATGATASTTGESLSYDAPAAGTFWLEVRSSGGATSAYAVGVAFTPPPPPNDGFDIDAATTLWRSDRYYEFFTKDGYGSGPVGEDVLGSMAPRYYAFDAVAAGTLVVLARNAYGDQDITLHDAARNPIAQSAKVGRADDRIDHVITAGGRFYLKVEPAEPLAMLEFDVWLEPTRTGEPNEDYLQGTFVAVPSVTNASMGGAYDVASETRCDVDWYELSTPGAGTLTVRVTGATADLDLAVYGAGPPIIPLAAGETAGVAGETVSIEVFAAGVYRAYVIAASCSATSDYALAVEFAPTP